jgi:hypothetical protein
MTPEQVKKGAVLLEEISNCEDLISRTKKGWDSGDPDWNEEKSDGYGAQYFNIRNFAIHKSTNGGTSILPRVSITAHSDGSGPKIVLSKSETYLLQGLIQQIIFDRKALSEMALNEL